MSGFAPKTPYGALLSQCRRYRYLLWRYWDWKRHYVNFVMLNPSTADAKEDDPTIRRCIGYAKDWGYGGLVVTNLFAFRSTNPKALRNNPDVIEQSNYAWVGRAASGSGGIVVGWGTHGGLYNQDRTIMSILCPSPKFVHGVSCLGTTKDGYPKHPLYLPLGLQPVAYKGRP